jgi:hypothetical protein
MLSAAGVVVSVMTLSRAEVPGIASGVLVELFAVVIVVSVMILSGGILALSVSGSSVSVSVWFPVGGEAALFTIFVWISE